MKRNYLIVFLILLIIGVVFLASTGTDAEKPPENGIVLVHKDSDAANYAQQLANERGWTYLAVEKDPIKIRDEIIKHAQNDDYLLILGSKDTIPITSRAIADKLLGEEEIEGYCEDGTPRGYCNNERTQMCVPIGENDVTLVNVCPDGSLSASESGEPLVLDSLYYGNIDNDPFVELRVGRIPFDDEETIENYFSSSVGGSGINLAEYPLASEEGEDEQIRLLRDEMAKNIIDGLEAYDSPSKDTLTDLIKSSRVFGIGTHGGTNSYSIPNGGGSFNVEEVPELSNHPVIIASSCGTAKLLGKEFIKKGAKAYFGAYYTFGGFDNLGFLKDLAIGKTIGETFKDTHNTRIAKKIARIKFGESQKSMAISDPSLIGTKIIENEDVSNLDTLVYETELEVHGITAHPRVIGEVRVILYGDPSLKVDVTGDVKKIQPNIRNKITFELSKPYVDESEEAGEIGIYKEIGVIYVGGPPTSPLAPNGTSEEKTSRFSEIKLPVSGIDYISDVSAVDENNNELEVRSGVLVKGNNERYLIVNQDALESKTTTTISFTAGEVSCCSDGTAYGSCSTTKPKYCDNGVLVDKCSTCGCSSGYECQSDGSCISSQIGGSDVPTDLPESGTPPGGEPSVSEQEPSRGDNLLVYILIAIIILLVIIFVVVLLRGRKLPAAARPQGYTYGR